MNAKYFRLNVNMNTFSGSENKVQAGPEEEVQGRARVRAPQGVQGLSQDGLPQGPHPGQKVAPQEGLLLRARAGTTTKYIM